MASLRKCFFLLHVPIASGVALCALGIIMQIASESRNHAGLILLLENFMEYHNSYRSASRYMVWENYWVYAGDYAISAQAHISNAAIMDN